MGEDAETIGGAPQVGPDLGLGRVGVAPLGVEGEGEGVEVRGDVALAAGVAVVPPRAAHVGVLLEHDEVVDALLAEADGGAQSGEAGADHGDAGVRHACSRVERSSIVLPHY